MKLLFKEPRSFFVIFLCVLFLDLIFVNIDHLYKYRYATKLCIVVALTIHFFYNSSNLLKKERILIFLALLFSLIADAVLITENLTSLIIGMSLFIVAKICYIIVYSFKAQFDIDRLLPFLAVTLLYSLFIMYFLYEGISELIVPVVIYSLISLIMTKMAYLRYKVVNNKSYYFVLIGAIFFMISETIMAFYSFYIPLPYSYTLIILTYAISQFLSVRGILLQNIPKD
jgi:uncharacterized membrane protein YhhN